MYEFEANLVCIGSQPGLHDQTLAHQNNDNNNNEKDYFLEAEFQYVSQTSLRFRGLPASASSVLGVEM